MNSTLRLLAPAVFVAPLVLVAQGEYKQTGSPSKWILVGSSDAASPTAKGVPAIDAGALLTKEDIAEVQGCAVTDVQSSDGKSGQLRVSQCFFSAAEPSRSVSLTVMQTDASAKGKRTAKEFWEDTFSRYDESKEEEEEKREAAQKAGSAAADPKKHETEEDEEKKHPPLRISGLGEEAFWTSNAVGGVLYVLKGEAFIRLSVGGPETPDAKLEKSKTLAVKVLKHL